MKGVVWKLLEVSAQNGFCVKERLNFRVHVYSLKVFLGVGLFYRKYEKVGVETSFLSA